LIRYDAERRRVVQVGRRTTEDDAVENVEVLRAEFQIPRLAPQEKLLEQGEVFTVQGRIADARESRGSSTKGKRRRLAEGGDIQIQVFCRVETAHGYRTPHVGGDPVGSISSAEQGNIPATAHAKRKAGFVGLNGIDLPATYNLVKHRAHVPQKSMVPPDRKLVSPRHDENVRAIDSHNAFLE